MSQKNIFLIFLIIALFILSPIAIYYSNFSGNGISKKTENWAQFADYIGGIVNTIIALLNLIVLIYLTHWLKKVEDNRSEWNIKELARPYGELAFDSDESYLEIRLINCGLGPLIITEMFIQDSNGKKITNLMETILPVKAKYNYRVLNVLNNHCAIAKETEPVILKISGDEKDLIFSAFLHNQREYLNGSEITIKYNDMYGRQISTLTEKINFT